MELTLSKRTLSIFAVAALVAIGAYALANRYGVFDMDVSLLDPRTWFANTGEAETDSPAIKAVEVALSPTGDQVQWEASICSNMTEQGCAIFKSIYAKPFWELQLEVTDVSFVKVVDELEDGSQVWQLESVKLDGSKMPTYIHAEQNDVGKWLLIRILFDQETRKYEEK